jgi:hypothetical protein
MYGHKRSCEICYPEAFSIDAQLVIPVQRMIFEDLDKIAKIEYLRLIVKEIAVESRWGSNALNELDFQLCVPQDTIYFWIKIITEIPLIMKRTSNHDIYWIYDEDYGEYIEYDGIDKYGYKELVIPSSNRTTGGI